MIKSLKHNYKRYENNKKYKQNLELDENDQIVVKGTKVMKLPKTQTKQECHCLEALKGGKHHKDCQQPNAAGEQWEDDFDKRFDYSLIDAVIKDIKDEDTWMQMKKNIKQYIRHLLQANTKQVADSILNRMIKEPETEENFAGRYLREDIWEELRAKYSEGEDEKH